MDLDYHRYKDLSDYFIKNYVEKSKDEDIYKLLDFYKCYRAYVRGKIGCFTYASPEISEEEKKEALDFARKYFDLAYYYAGGIPKIIIFFGLSGTGKTFLSQNLLKKLPAVYLASDIIRKNLLKLDPSKHYYAQFEKGIYSPEITLNTYEKMIDMAIEELSYGRDVIIDATFREKKFRDLLKEKLKKVKAKVYWILCTAEDEVIKERISKRLLENTYSDALWDIYLSQKQKFIFPEDCSPLLVLNTSDSLEDLLNKIFQFLKN
jgi:predicted kinase